MAENKTLSAMVGRVFEKELKQAYKKTNLFEFEEAESILAYCLVLVGSMPAEMQVAHLQKVEECALKIERAKEIHEKLKPASFMD